MKREIIREFVKNNPFAWVYLTSLMIYEMSKRGVIHVDFDAAIRGGTLLLLGLAVINGVLGLVVVFVFWIKQKH